MYEESKQTESNNAEGRRLLRMLLAPRTDDSKRQRSAGDAPAAASGGASSSGDTSIRVNTFDRLDEIDDEGEAKAENTSPNGEDKPADCLDFKDDHCAATLPDSDSPGSKAEGASADIASLSEMTEQP